MIPLAFGWSSTRNDVHERRLRNITSRMSQIKHIWPLEIGRGWGASDFVLKLKLALPPSIINSILQSLCFPPRSISHTGNTALRASNSKILQPRAHSNQSETLLKRSNALSTPFLAELLVSRIIQRSLRIAL